MKLYAPTIARVFLGVSFIYGAMNHSIFGPEIPLLELGVPHVFQAILFITGAMLLLGILGRLAALVALLLYIYVFSIVGDYTISYVNYLAEIILILIAGSGVFSLDNFITHTFGNEISRWKARGMRFENKYGGLLLRLGLGFALLWAAINVKFLHAQLTLDVINNYHLTKYFPFDPLFIVLGSGLVEICIALMYIFGVLIRFNTLFFLSFITLSLTFFGEAVWPHFILYGIALAIFAYGYDRYTLQHWIMRFLKRGKEEDIEGIF
jgi:hypothetical protein